MPDRDCALERFPLPSEFYLDPPDLVARKLLGKLLVREMDGQVLQGRIVETEAYFGQDDPAAHAFRGKSARNEVLFGRPGCAYVYFIYGMHSCLNVACEPEGQAGCVLLRALEPISGLATMARLRNLSDEGPLRLLTSGPGRLCEAFGLTRQTHNGTDLTNPNSDLRIAADRYQPGAIHMTPRIGIRKAVTMPLRFLIADSAFVSASPRKSLPSITENGT